LSMRIPARHFSFDSKVINRIESESFL